MTTDRAAHALGCGSGDGADHRGNPSLAEDPELRYGFLLHDIGKIGIPDAILLKKRVDSRPVRWGSWRCTRRSESTYSRRFPFLSELAHDVVAYHHERWERERLPVGSSGRRDSPRRTDLRGRRCVRRDDCDRPRYRDAMSASQAIEELSAAPGPIRRAVVAAFLPLVRQLAAPSGH